MAKGKSLPGVYPAKKKDGTEYYRASMTYKRKHISLGSYDSMFAAHLAYKDADALLHDSSIKIDAYNKINPSIQFDKFVSIINLRDNDIYIANPIYLQEKFFYYYLSPDFVFKFDMDDLFYYSSHKIMRRNGHFFVAEYGMQYNIMNRYGIMSNAVLGKDYEFYNDDPTDFRYENIHIINSYHGVKQKKKKNINVYQAHIHINGNYLVGTYRTAEEAAVAYNKAIDILKRNGFHKNFSPNYIESLSPRQYADMYSRLIISEKIVNYNVPPKGDK